MMNRLTKLCLLIASLFVLGGCISLWSKTVVPPIDLNIPIVDEDFDDPETAMVVSTQADGYVSVENGHLRIKGRNADDTADEYVITTSLTGSTEVADFTIEYDYTPTNTAWNDDRLVFRSDGGEGRSYGLRIVGTEHTPGNEISLIKNAAATPPLATAPIDLKPDTEYHVKVTMEGSLIKVYFHEKSDNAPSDPILQFHDMETPNQRGTFHFTSWAGNYAIDNLKIWRTANVQLPEDEDQDENQDENDGNQDPDNGYQVGEN